MSISNIESRLRCLYRSVDKDQFEIFEHAEARRIGAA
jgi:hypothetical protein